MLRTVFLLSIISLSCLGESFSDEAPVRIGVIQSLTGFAASYGRSNLQGIELAGEYINATRQPHVEIFVEDDGTIPASTAAAFMKLKNRSVDAVLGATWDFTTNPILPLAARERLPVLCSSTGPEVLRLVDGKGYAFSNWISVRGESLPFEAFLRRSKASTVTFVTAPNSWGESLRKAHGAIAEAFDARILDDFVTASNDSNDWSTILPRLAAKKPEALVLLVNKGDVEQILRKRAELKIVTPVFTTANGADALSESNNPGLYEGVCLSYPLEQMARNKEFIKRFEAKYHESPRKCADTSFEGLVLLYEAAVRARKEHRGLHDVLRNVSFPEFEGMYAYSDEFSLSKGTSSLTCIHSGKMSIASDIPRQPIELE